MEILTIDKEGFIVELYFPNNGKYHGTGQHLVEIWMGMEKDKLTARRIFVYASWAVNDLLGLIVKEKNV